MKYYPVGIVVLDRYLHFRQCIESLARCTHAKKTELVIGVDYPPSEKYRAGYEQVKAYLPAIGGFAKVTLICHDHNVGSVKNIESVFAYCRGKYSAMIFSEDDNVFSPCFLDFMNKALERYADDPRIESVCGFRYGKEPAEGRRIFTTIESLTWGYGVWFAKLDVINADVGTPGWADGMVMSPRIVCRLLMHYPYYLGALVAMVAGGVAWDDIGPSLRNIFCGTRQLRPSRSLVRNIGWDGSGCHCSERPSLHTLEISEESIFDFGEEPPVDLKMDAASYYQQEGRGDWRYRLDEFFGYLSFRRRLWRGRGAVGSFDATRRLPSFVCDGGKSLVKAVKGEQRVVAIRVNSGICDQIKFLALGRMLEERNAHVVYVLDWYRKYGKDIDGRFARVWEAQSAFPKVACEIAEGLSGDAWLRVTPDRAANVESLPSRTCADGYAPLLQTVWDGIVGLRACFSPCLDDRSAALAESIGNGVSCAVHVRRGDLSVPNEDYGAPPSVSYYVRAVRIVQALCPNARFFFFSDEPNYVEKEILPTVDFAADVSTVVRGNGSDRGSIDLYLMTRCSYIIGSHGSFGVFAAALSDQNRLLITPCRNNFVFQKLPHVIYLNEDRGFIRKERDVALLDALQRVRRSGLYKPLYKCWKKLGKILMR